MLFDNLSFILCSASPRRLQLLQGLDINFIVDTNTLFKEEIDFNIAPRDIPLYFAEGKSTHFHRPLNDNEVLITADTMVIVGDTPLGKPKDIDQAKEFLMLLSAKEHSVITGVCIRDKNRKHLFSSESKVKFAPLSPDEIDYYVAKYAPLDKAGAYGVQEWIGYIGIENINGSYYNVMGLPIHKLYNSLKELYLK